MFYWFIYLNKLYFVLKKKILISQREIFLGTIGINKAVWFGSYAWYEGRILSSNWKKIIKKINYRKITLKL